MIGKGYNAFLSAIKSVVGSFDDYLRVPFVFGSKLNTIMAHLNTMYYHVHGEPFLFPLFENPKTLTSSAEAWSQTGTLVEIIPADATDRAFDIHFCVISDISTNLEGVIGLYAGAEGEEVLIPGVWEQVHRGTNFSREMPLQIMIPPQPAGTRISARFVDNTSSAQTVDIKLKGHYYG